MDSRLSAACARWGCSDPRPLSGDAGARQYFRVVHPHLGTALVVLFPPAEPGKPDDAYFDYRALQAYLDPVVAVPTTIHHEDEDRVLLIEDLGDQTLEKRLSQRPDEELKWANAVADQLETWSGLLTEGAPPRAFFMLRAFDPEKFAFEWDFCRRHFFADFLRKDPPRWLDRMMDDVHGFLSLRAHTLAHRDFHVRNLMVRGDRLITIDFQDARRGAATYDLASILFDGYWDWSPEAGRRLQERMQAAHGWSEGRLWEELTPSALQRNLKALGTFGFQLVHRKKAHFASAVPRTLRHVLAHFRRMRHGEGVLAAEHWMRLADQRMLDGL